MSVQSTYNVVTPLCEGNGTPPLYALFNTLAGSLDVIDDSVLRGLAGLPGRRPTVIHVTATPTHAPASCAVVANPTPSNAVQDYLARRGYLFEDYDDEWRRAAVLYREMLHFHRASVRQPLVIIPSYRCNMHCSYCWQRLHGMDSGVMSEAMVDTAFAALPQLRETGPPDKVDLVVFGGEPLMDEPEQQTRVQGILNRGRAMGFSTKILSNGISLEEAVPWLAGRVDVVQVTIDGPQNIHAARRRLPHGDSFAPMVTGVTTAVAAGMRINLRINVDECNVDRLPELADTIDAQGWMDSGLVRAILAPVKNHNPKRAAIDESVLLARVLQLVHSDWRMGIYELEGFSGIKYFNGFRDTGLLSLHRFFSCEAQINFYALDVHGDVYACWDAAGIRNLAVGHFHPELHIDEAKLQHWRARSSLAFEPCGTCPSSPHCGGGCQFLAYEHSQRFEAPSCDSMLDGFAQAVHDNASWLLERARTGDHAVGLVTSDGVVQPVTHPFGLLEQGTEAPLLIDC